MGFWSILINYIVWSFIAYITTPSHNPGGPDASSLGDVSAPTADESRALTVVMGTVKLKSPNVVWYGDLRTEPVYEVTKGPRKYGLFGPRKKIKTQIGHKYFIGMQMGLCIGPIDSVSALYVQDKAAWSGSVSGGDKAQIYIDKEELFGGKKKEGGVKGTVDFYFGTTTQTPNDYLEDKIGQALPAYRRLCYAVLRQGYIGTNVYLKAWAWVVTRLPKSLGSGCHNINGDANPAEMIYELMTDSFYGMGLSPDRVDVDNFLSVAHKLYAEGFGLSMQFDTQKKAEDIINAICRHVDMVLYVDTYSGKFKLSLTRDDYDISTLLDLNVTNVKSVDKSAESWTNTYNEVKVTYIDRGENFTSRTASAQDLANVRIQGGEVNSTTVEYSGISNYAMAAKMAMRSLKVMSIPLKKLKIVTSRIASKLYPGAVFKLTWIPFGIYDKVYRIVRINYGELEKGQIELECIEDVFSLSDGIVIPPPPVRVNPVIPDPVKVDHQRLLEMPRHLVGDSKEVAVIATRPASHIVSYDVYSMDEGETEYENTKSYNSFTPTGKLVSTYSQGSDAVDEIGFLIESMADVGVLQSTTAEGLSAGHNLLIIDNEIMSWRDIISQGDGTYLIKGVMRGIMDTVPMYHADASLVYFISDGLGDINDMSIEGEDITIGVKLVTSSASGSLSLSQAEAMTIATQSRSVRPYPPANILIGSGGWRFPEAIAGDAVVTWSHRVKQVTQLVRQDDPDTGTPPVVYNYRIFVGDVLKHEISGITVKEFTYTIPERIADDADGSQKVRIEIESVEKIYPDYTQNTSYPTGFQVVYSGEVYLCIVPHVSPATPEIDLTKWLLINVEPELPSLQAQEREFIMTGYGMTYGMYYGGVQ